MRETKAPEMPGLGLSVAVISLNEADRIPRLIESVAFADEIVLVDSGSTDGTTDIARFSGATVIHHQWEGYTAQKQFALEACSCDWILNLDADEAISPELREEIVSSVRNAGTDVNGFSMPRLSRYLNRWIRHGGWYPDRKVRLVRKGLARWTGTALHERLEVSGTVSELKNPILHYVYRDISDQIGTVNRFSSVDAEARGPRGNGYVCLGVLHAIGKFLECAVWKGGLRDGIPGLVIAMNSAFYVFLKHAKAWEKGIPAETGEAAPSEQANRGTVP